METCRACGRELPLGVHRCEACGAWVTPPTQREAESGPVVGKPEEASREPKVPVLEAPRYAWPVQKAAATPTVPGYSQPPYTVAQPQNVPAYSWQQTAPVAVPPTYTVAPPVAPVYAGPAQSYGGHAGPAPQVQNGPAPVYTPGWPVPGAAVQAYYSPPVGYNAPASAPPPVYRAAAYTPVPVVKEEKPKKEGEPELSAGACTGMILAGLVPLVGLFLCLLWGFGSETPPQKRAIARALLWVHAIALLALLIALAVWVAGLWGKLA